MSAIAVESLSLVQIAPLVNPQYTSYTVNHKEDSVFQIPSH